MNINFIKKTLLLFALSLAIVSCDRDDQVGDSELNPTNPNIDITLDFSSPDIVVEDDSEYDFTVTLSTPNVVDTKVYVEQVGGTADDHDYEVTGLIVIPAGYTAGTGTLKILADTEVEPTETLVLQVGDQRTANSQMTPANIEFAILNATSDDLVIDLAWYVNEPAYDEDSGEEYSATDMADMRLLVYDDMGTLIGGADGGSFETYVFSGENSDGVYYVVTDFYEPFEAPVVRDISFTNSFEQYGVFSTFSYDFPDALDNGQTCPDNYFTLAMFTKTGSSYVIEPIGEDNSLDAEGDWTLEMTDLYGDGWNGGYLSVLIDGEETQYASLDGGGPYPGAVTTTEVVSVPAGAAFSIEYVGGDFEEENLYTITGPDGNEISDGPTPTEGVVVDNGIICL